VNTPEERIARFTVETGNAEIPPEARRTASAAAFDCVGVALAGAAQPLGRMMIELAREEGGRPDATVIGGGLCTSPAMAALANGTLAHALDYDDMGSFGHPSVVLLPPVLALGEKLGASGREILDAYVIGFEVGAGLCAASHYVQTERGFHTTALFGTMGATAAAARLLKLGVAETVMAFGIAGSMPGGVVQNFGTMVKPLHAGMAARNGVLAALLARKGYVGTDSIFRSKLGFLAAYVGEGHYDLEKAVSGLGQPFRLQDLLVIKKYPCCGTNHSALDSTLSLMRESNLSFDDIAEVTVEGLPYLSHVLLYPEPREGLNGKFSVHYNVAAAILDRTVAIETHSDPMLRRPRVQDALAKVRIEVQSRWDPRYTAAPAETPVTIRLKDGRVLRRSTDRHTMHGTAVDPLTPDELVAKFEANAALSLDGEGVTRARDIWLRIDQVPDIREAMVAVGG
jgi:2-methylcitrate dehydratase PrpD